MKNPGSHLQAARACCFNVAQLVFVRHHKEITHSRPLCFYSSNCISRSLLSASFR